MSTRVDVGSVDVCGVVSTDDDRDARRDASDRRSPIRRSFTYMNTKQAIEHVLAGKRRGLRVPQIIEAGVPLATSLKGRTPGQTFYSVLYSEAKRPDGLVVQTGRGEFKLNPRRRRAKAAA
jgi:hypothetical protein